MGKIKIIKGHKLGPVYAVSKVYDFILDDQPVILNYCDFFLNWDYSHFKLFIESSNCDGAIPCYTGFPHTYFIIIIYTQAVELMRNGIIRNKRKFSFESNKLEAYHSGGNYYFKSGKILKKYCDKLIENKESLNQEYYASLVYNNMCKDGLKTLVYDKVDHFCQWGTPFDLEAWSIIIGLIFLKKYKI